MSCEESAHLSELVHAGAGGEQRARHVVVSALRRDPQRAGAVRARAVHCGTVLEQHVAHVLVTVLRRYEQGAGFVLEWRTNMEPVYLT